MQFNWRKNLEVFLQLTPFLHFSKMTAQPMHAPYLSLGTSPQHHRGRPYGISLLYKLSFIVKADWMSGGPRLNQSNLLFSESRIRILRCWPDSDTKFGLSQEHRRLVCRKGKIECCRYADKGRNERPHHPREVEKQI